MTAQIASILEKAAPNMRVPADDPGYAGSALGDKVEHARERVGDLYERAKARAVQKEAEFEGYVKEHPVKSVLVAAGIGAGVGLVLGVLLGRR